MKEYSFFFVIPIFLLVLYVLVMLDNFLESLVYLEKIIRDHN